MRYLALLALLVSSVASASDATVTWAFPTQNTDGTAIPATGAGSIASTRVEYGTCSGTAFGVKSGEVTVLAPATSATITGFAAGSTACFRAYAKNSYGNESAASVVVSKTFPTPVPNPPVLSSTITVAYEIVPDRWDGVKIGRMVGSIALKTPCSGEPIQTSKGEFYQVDRSAVTLTKQPKSDVVVTKCAIS